MADIFISYASPDRETARTLAERLAELGYTVWWDRTIPPGRQFDEVIQEALHAARCVIVLWSTESVRSNWVKTEAAEALALDRLVPALIEDVPPPMEFKRIQAANLSAWSGDTSDPEYLNLLASAQALLRRAATSAAAGAARPQGDAGAPIKLARSRPSALTVAIAAAVVLSVAVALMLFLRSAERRDLSAGAPPPPAATATTWPTSAEPPPIADSAPASRASAPAPTTPGRRGNLLAVENGGEMVVAAHEDWLYTVDGKDDTYAWTNTGEAVFAFQGGRPATFDTFAVFIPGTADGNLREFELLAGNDGPTGHFDSIGVFTTQNLRVMKNPYQEFHFPAVKAKYLKVRSLESHANSGAVIAYEFRLLGSVD